MAAGGGGAARPRAALARHRLQHAAPVLRGRAAAPGFGLQGQKTFFDTNVSEHHHFYNEDDETVVDIPGSTIQVAGLPEAPEGMMISSVEVIVRLRRADGQEIETRTTEHRGHEGRVAAGGH